MYKQKLLQNQKLRKAQAEKSSSVLSTEYEKG